MSKYTTEIRFICETSAGLIESVGFNSVNDIIQKAIPNIFNFDFPIFDESYRNVLCTKILKHYYTREIAFETVGLWKLKLETKLNEIMPYYNELYKSETFEYNPLHDTDYKREHTLSKSGNNLRTDNLTGERTDNLTRTEEDNRKTETTVDSDSIDKFSDTPQGAISDLKNSKYLTNATIDELDSTTIQQNSGKDTVKNTGSQTNTNTGTVKNDFDSTDEYTEYVVGKMNSNKSYASIIQEYRKSLLNIDMMIINELSDLFFLLW